jgi:hypothetical protein
MPFSPYFRSVFCFPHFLKSLTRLFARGHEFREGRRSQISSRVASLALVVCLLSSSTPAAPQMIVALAKESSISFGFWFRASGLVRYRQRWNAVHRLGLPRLIDSTPWVH